MLFTHALVGCSYSLGNLHFASPINPELNLANPKLTSHFGSFGSFEAVGRNVSFADKAEFHC